MAAVYLGIKQLQRRPKMKLPEQRVSPLKINALQFTLILVGLLRGVRDTHALRIGYLSGSYNYGAISLAVEQAQADGLMVNENIRLK